MPQANITAASINDILQSRCTTLTLNPGNVVYASSQIYFKDGVKHYYLLDALKRNQSLTSIVLENFQNAQQCVMELMAAVLVSSCPLKSITIRNCQLKDQHADQLLRLITTCNKAKQVEELNLSANELELAIPISSLTIPIGQIFIDRLAKFTSLKRLDLSHNDLYPLTLFKIFHGIRDSLTALTGLNIVGNFGNGMLTESIMQVIDRNQLEEFGFSISASNFRTYKPSLIEALIANTKLRHLTIHSKELFNSRELQAIQTKLEERAEPLIITLEPKGRQLLNFMQEVMQPLKSSLKNALGWLAHVGIGQYRYDTTPIQYAIALCNAELEERPNSHLARYIRGIATYHYLEYFPLSLQALQNAEQDLQALDISQASHIKIPGFWGALSLAPQPEIARDADQAAQSKPTTANTNDESATVDSTQESINLMEQPTITVPTAQTTLKTDSATDAAQEQVADSASGNAEQQTTSAAQSINADSKNNVQVSPAAKPATDLSQTSINFKEQVMPISNPTSIPSSPTLTVDIPEEYICPLTHKILYKPVGLSDGYSYEQEAITAWLQNNHTSPITKELLTDTTLHSQLTFQKLIRKFLAANPSLLEQAYLPQQLKQQLQAAFASHNESVIEQLLNTEPRLLTVNLASVGYATALHLACEYGPVSVLKAILARLGERFNEVASDGERLVEQAGYQLGIEAANLIAEHLGWSTANYNNHLQMALVQQDMARARLYLRLGADMNQVDSAGRSLLHRAVDNLQPEQVNLLLEQGTAVNQADNMGNTPLHAAASHDLSPILQTIINHLIQRGANYKAYNQANQTPMTLAEAQGHCAVAQYIRETSKAHKYSSLIKKIVEQQVAATLQAMQAPANISLSMHGLFKPSVPAAVQQAKAEALDADVQQLNIQQNHLTDIQNQIIQKGTTPKLEAEIEQLEKTLKEVEQKLGKHTASVSSQQSKAEVEPLADDINQLEILQNRLAAIQEQILQQGSNSKLEAEFEQIAHSIKTLEERLEGAIDTPEVANLQPGGPR